MTVLAVYGWRHRSAQGGLPFVVCMILSAELMLATALVMASPTREAAIIWGNIRFIALAFLSVAWLLLVFEYTGQRAWLSPRRIALLMIIPLVTQVMVWTDAFTGQWGVYYSYERVGPFWMSFMAKTAPGSWFWVHTAYSYLLLLVGMILIVRMAVRSPRLYRSQALAMVVGMLAPAIATLLITFRMFTGWTGIPPAIGLTISGLAFAWAIFRYRLFDLVPIAREKLIDGMDDGMLVLDDQQRVVDLNPAMARLLDIPTGRAIGSAAMDMLGSWPELVWRFSQGNVAIGEVERQQAKESRHYDLNVLALADRKGRPAGQLLVLHDITARVRAERALQAEKAISEKLLLNILPEPIARRLKAGEEPLADGFGEVSVLFADIVSFTSFAEKLLPQDLVILLNDLFSRFDDLSNRFSLEKIKTSGDAYIAVSGVPVPQPRHAQIIADMALEMLSELARFNQARRLSLEMRFGIHSGPVVAGVIGKKKFVYDLWGDAVNTASRMESHGIAGQIQVSESTYRLLNQEYEFYERGVIEVKGKGEMRTWFLQGKAC